MSFLENNKFYIQQSLYSGMAGLSFEEKSNKYNSIRSEMRSRIFKAYPKNNPDINEASNADLNLFYKELFDAVGELEIEYIIANLLFEPNFSNIVYYLKNNSEVFKSLISPPFKEYTFKWFLYFYLEENDFFKFVFIKFLKDFICSYTSLINKHLEIQIKKNGPIFEFVHEYPKWLIDNLTKSSNIDQIIFIHLLVVKLLNLEPTFIEHEKGSYFSIILLNELSKAYNLKISSGESPKLHSFYTKTNKLIDTFFTKNSIAKTPLFDSEERSNYSRGVYIKRKEFLNQIQQAEILNNDMKNESYLFLFQMFIKSSSIIQEKIKTDILNKIKLFEFPTNQDLKELKNINVPDDLACFKRWFISKFYLYEI